MSVAAIPNPSHDDGRAGDAPAWGSYADWLLAARGEVESVEHRTRGGVPVQLVLARLREEVLRGLGWSLHRVWSTDWMQSRDKALARLLAAIDAAQACAVKPAAESPSPLPTNPPPEPQPAAAEPQADLQFASAMTVAAAVPNLAPGARRYEFASLPDGRRGPESFYLSAFNQAVSNDIAVVLMAECPIHREELADRVARAWGLQRITRRVEDRMDDLLKRLEIKVSDDGFVRGSQVVNDATFRVPGDGEQRDLQFVAPEEIRAAVQSVIASQGNLPMDSMIYEVAKLFGFTRVRDATRALIQSAIH